MVLAHVETTVDTTSPLIGPQVGWRAAVFVAVALIHTRPWGRKKKEHMAGGVGGASISLPLISAHASPNLYFPGQSGEHTKAT